MDINLVQEELIKRYLYLYDNKELILALCIGYGIEEKYYKKEIKKVTELLYSIEEEKGHSELKTTQVEMLSSLLEGLNEGLREPKLYLFAKVNDEIVNAYEDFLFTDQNIEDTVLYKHIEALKNNPNFLESVQDSINGLEERRQNNMHLKRIPTFTVWKILTYVKNKNKNNSVVLEALEKYYNIDRYMLTGIDWKSGYKLLPTDYESEEKLSVFPNSRLIGESNIGGQYSAVICNYPGNEFEEEDDYSVFDWSLEFEEQPLNNYSKTDFMAALKDMPMLSEKLKIEIYKKLKSSSKKMTKNL